MHHVYFLQSTTAPKTYVGETADTPDERTAEHNAGKNSYTRQHAPWKLAGYITVTNRTKALALEEYYKSGAGRAFLAKYIFKEMS